MTCVLGFYWLFGSSADSRAGFPLHTFFPNYVIKTTRDLMESALDNQGTMSSGPIHPYYPRDLRLPHYVPNEKSAAELVGVFFGGIAVFMVLTWFLASSVKTVKFSVLQRIILCWFVMSGIIHSVLEGYFGIYHQTLAGRMTFLGQVCKFKKQTNKRVVCLAIKSRAIYLHIIFVSL